jgi:hypothetical protein
MLKTKTERALLLAVAFLAGCEASRVAQMMAPAIEHTAHASVPARQFEYYCMRGTDLRGEGDITPLMNAAGREGWELASAAGAGWSVGMIEKQNMVWCFKRPVSGVAAAPAAPAVQ